MPFTRTLQLKSILEDDHAFATTLAAITINEFGMDVMEWEPETLIMELRDTFQANIPQVNRDKIWGLITALTTNLFYIDPVIFNGTCQAFNGERADFQEFVPISCEGAAWGTAEVILNDNGEPNENPALRFSESVRRYVGVLIDNRGLIEIPSVLSFALPNRDLSSGMDQYADDPRLYEGLLQLNKANGQTIENYVRERTRALFEELRALDLGHPLNLSSFSPLRAPA